MVALMTRMSRLWIRSKAWVSVWVRSMPVWWSFPAWRRVMVSGVVDAVGADVVVGACGGAGRCCFGSDVVGGRGGRLMW